MVSHYSLTVVLNQVMTSVSAAIGIKSRVKCLVSPFEYANNKCADQSAHPHNLHYDNTSMQYTMIFHGCKNDNFQMKKCDIFLIFAKNIDSGCTLERRF